MNYKAINKRFLSSQEMDNAARALFEAASEEKVTAALCGGMAMQLYGSDRMTVDIDFIADDILLKIPSEGKLSFGGEKYRVAGVIADWITREDEERFVYDAALGDRIKFDTGLWVIKPEWLALIKYLTRRSKDELDLMFLLRTPGLVNRTTLKKYVKDLFGRAAFATLTDLENLFLEADLMRARDERHNG